MQLLDVETAYNNNEAALQGTVLKVNGVFEEDRSWITFELLPVWACTHFFLDATHNSTQGFESHVMTKDKKKAQSLRAYRADDRLFSLSSRTSPAVGQDGASPCTGKILGC
jgi:hypothetical protein